MNRAYSLLTIKAVNDDERIIEGIATTPSPDRLSDVVESDGIEYTLPLPLLYQHNSRQPIGKVIKATVTKAGITIKAQFGPAGIVGFIDEAWELVKHGLVSGLSIGFRALEQSYNNETGGFHFLRSEWMELSVVTIPANAEATILTVKSADQLLRAASGITRNGAVRVDTHKNLPGASGQQTRTVPMKTIQEQISACEAKRAADMARMGELMTKSGEDGRTLDPTEEQEYDGLQTEVRSVDAHLVRLKAHETQMVDKGTRVTVEGTNGPDKATQTRSGVTVNTKSNLPPGTAFTRYAMALAASRGSRFEAAEYAKRWKDTTPEVELVLRAAMAAGTTTDADWAAPLVEYQNIATEFIELLRPQTIIGRIENLRKVPFNIKMPTQTQGATVGWVGQGVPKPVSELKFGQIALGMAKAAGIVVLSEELVRSSSPSAEAIVRADLTAAIAQFLDRQFVDPAVAEVPNVSPASITNGVTPIVASGITSAALRNDIKALFARFIAANLSPTTGVWIMTPTMALAIGMMQNALGQPEFPTLTIMGGTFMGLPVVVSENVPANVGVGSPLAGGGARIILVNASDILLADDGGVTLDVSREASLQMDSAPDSPATASTVLVSLWQMNLVGLRAERYINWRRRRLEAVVYLDAANYGNAA